MSKNMIILIHLHSPRDGAGGRKSLCLMDGSVRKRMATNVKEERRRRGCPSKGQFIALKGVIKCISRLCRGKIQAPH